MLKNFLNSKFNSIKTLFLTYSIVTFILLGVVLLWLMGKTYASYMEVKKLEMEYAIAEIEMGFTNMLDYAESIMGHIGKQIGVSNGAPQEIKEILTSFSRRSSAGKDSIRDNLSIDIFSWVNDKQSVTINSEYGIIRVPYDVSNRKYLQQTINDPWVMKVCAPVIGVVSGQQIIPAGLGVESLRNKKYLGTIVLGFTVDSLTDKLRKIINNPNLDFTILNKDGEIMLESTAGIFSEDTVFLRNIAASHIKREAIVSAFSMFDLDETYLIAKSTNKHPYVVIAGYQNLVITKGLVVVLWPYILGFIILSLIFFSVWYALRLQIIKPIVQLSNVSRLVVQDRDDEVVMPVSGVAEIMELTEQVRLIERYKLNLIQAKKSQERFFANMSHELRTPLNGILNFSLMMKKEMFGPLDPEYQEMASDIHSSGAHLLNLVNDILDFSKMDIGKMKLNEEEFDMIEEVKSAMKIVLSDVERYGENSAVSVISKIEIKDVNFYGDRRMFKQILLNLLSNASKFVEVGSIILKLFIDEDKNLILEIADTGIGIKEEDLARLVVEFGQVGDGYYRGKKQGSGLGLFLVKKMAELHQGKFEIKSIYDTRTTVRVTFPGQRIIANNGNKNG